ncbi:hypothetical protein FNH05_25290 [Amycolatopsis rhizosphaerae]|uniref:Uncharacterized protein n=1 Tax=Amycolatopsis rhizosphaerae TaxID=2053003 RepID=A0A558BJM8_9PSEU|nr:hypothetical protein FNH05_25290 [Amycolatopsis rhizosphaerae]
MAAILVLVLGVGGFVWPGFFTASRSDPTSVAESFADAIRNADTAAALRLVCPAQQGDKGILDAGSGREELLGALPAAVRAAMTITNRVTMAQVRGQAVTTGTTATATVHVEGSLHPESTPGSHLPALTDRPYSRDTRLTLQQQGGKWCVSGATTP